MRAKKKAVQVLQHPDGGEQTRLDGFDELPKDNFITAFSPAQGSIAALLPHERGAALTTAQIARITGQKPRAVTLRICAERRNGAPILSDPAAGFWLAADADELKRCAAALHRRAGQVHATARSLESILKGGAQNEGR